MMASLRTNVEIGGRMVNLMRVTSWLSLKPRPEVKSAAHTVLAVGPLRPVIGELARGGIIGTCSEVLPLEYHFQPAEDASLPESIAMLKRLDIDIDSHFNLRGVVVAADHLAFRPDEAYKGHDATESMNGAAGGILTLGLIVNPGDHQVPFALPLPLHTDNLHSCLAPHSTDTHVAFSLTTTVENIINLVKGHFATWSGPFLSSTKFRIGGLAIFSLELVLFNKTTGRGVQGLIPSGQLIKQMDFYSK